MPQLILTHHSSHYHLQYKLYLLLLVQFSLLFRYHSYVSHHVILFIFMLQFARKRGDDCLVHTMPYWRPGRMVVALRSFMCHRSFRYQ
jgi:hypothetical protein